jgi:hypothetical protein
MMEYDGVRIDLADVSHRDELEALAQTYIDAGMRPPMLTVKAGRVDVSKAPDLRPASVRDYRGPGRLEWVCQPDESALRNR